MQGGEGHSQEQTNEKTRERISARCFTSTNYVAYECRSLYLDHQGTDCNVESKRSNLPLPSIPSLSLSQLTASLACATLFATSSNLSAIASTTPLYNISPCLCKTNVYAFR